MRVLFLTFLLCLSMASGAAAQNSTVTQEGPCPINVTGGQADINCTFVTNGRSAQDQLQLIESFRDTTTEARINEAFGAPIEEGVLLEGLNIRLWQGLGFKFFLIFDGPERIAVGVFEEPDNQTEVAVPLLTLLRSIEPLVRMRLEDFTIGAGTHCAAPMGPIDARYVYFVFGGCYLGRGGNYTTWELAMPRIGWKLTRPA